MKKKTLLRISIDEENGLDVRMPDANLALDAIISVILGDFMNGETGPMDMLLSVTTNVLARESSGKLQDEFIEALREHICLCKEYFRKNGSAGEISS